jgi:hypothetical protein
MLYLEDRLVYYVQEDSRSIALPVGSKSRDLGS